MTQAMTILIHNWILPARIGVLATEHEAPQRLRLHIDITLAPTAWPSRDDIADTVCYNSLRQKIAARLLARHTQLLEILVQDIAAICLTDDRIIACRVRAEKLDIYTDGSTVGVDIQQSKPVSP